MINDAISPPLLSLHDTIKKYQLLPNKKLGQHFLTDGGLLHEITRYAGGLDGVHVIEIGAGPGGLTRALLASSLASLTVVELDDRAIPALQAVQATDARLYIIEGDALEYDIMQMPSPRAIVANLPYNVGTPLIIRWLKNIKEHRAEAVQSITVMLQQEVVQRITAEVDSPHYGRLAVLCQWLCEVQHCMDVPPSAFTPPPKVMSSVVRLHPRAQPAFDADFKQVERFLAAAFGQRRKMLRGSLKGWCENPSALLEKAGIDPTRRAETLSLQEIGRIISTNRA